MDNPRYHVSIEEIMALENELRDLLGISDDEDDRSSSFWENLISDESANNDEDDYEGESASCWDVLKECAWSILHDNPGTDFGDWQDMLIEQYPAEVVDALGSSPGDVFPALSDLWDCNDYEEPITEMCHNFQEWAEYFVNERSVELFDELIEARREIKRLEAIKIFK